MEHLSRAAPNVLDRLRFNKKTLQVVKRVVEMLTVLNWAVVSHISNFHPDAWENDPILTKIFFKWVGSTTN